MLACALVFVLLPAVVLRFLGIEHNPPGLWQDEASTGFDAYLLWTTGRDRAGAFLPVIAASFGDYPLALYRYLTAPVVGLLGLSPGNERAVAALAGSLLLISTALFVWRRIGGVAAFGALLAGAFAPMWVHFSRYGSEAILLPFCLMTGALAIEVGRRPDRRSCLWLGVVALAASAYTYHAVKLILPLWLAAYLVYSWPLLSALWARERRHVIGPALLFAALVLPSLLAALTPEGMARGRVVMAWHHYHGWNLPRNVLAQWLGYFELNALFLRGGPHLAQSEPGIGLFNLIDLPLMGLGFVVMSRGIAPRLGEPRQSYEETSPPTPARVYGFLAFWFLLGPLPGGMTYETQNVGRAIAWLPVPQIISGLGLAWLVVFVVRGVGGSWSGARKIPKVALLVGLAGLWLWTMVAVYQKTLVEYPRLAEREFQFEISGALQCARSHLVTEKLVVSPGLLGGEVAEAFVGFYFGDRFEVRGKTNRWELGLRHEVPPNELYVTNPTPSLVGRKLCDVRNRSGAVVAQVFAHDEDSARADDERPRASDDLMPAPGREGKLKLRPSPKAPALELEPNRGRLSLPHATEPEGPRVGATPVAEPGDKTQRQRAAAP